MTNDKTNSAKKLGLPLLVALVVGSIIGSGIFALPQNMSVGAGAGAIVIGWLITGVGMLMLAFVYQMLATRRPELDNGIYAYARALSGDYVGFNAAWGYWLSAWIGNVGYLVAAFSALGFFYPGFGEGNTLEAVIGASAVLWVVHVLVLRGIQGATVLNAAVTIAKILPLLLFIVLLATAFKIDTFKIDFWGDASLGSVLTQVKSTMLVTVWVFIGIEGASVYSARAQNRADVGRATVAGFLICLGLLSAVSLLSLGLMSQPELAGLKNPSMAAVLEKAVGHWGALVIYIGVIVSVGGGFLAWTLLAAESLFTPAQGGVMPVALTKLNSNGVPANALWLTSFMVQLFLVITLVSNASYLALISLSTAMILLPYLFSAVFAAKVAFTPEKGAQTAAENIAFKGWEKPVTVLAAVYCLWLLYAAGPKYLLLSALLYAPGAALFYWSKHQRHETAFTKTEMRTLVALWGLAAFAVYRLAAHQIAL